MALVFIILSILASNTKAVDHLPRITQPLERDLITGVISLDGFISNYNVVIAQQHHYEGACAKKWNLLRHCLRVVVKCNLVQGVSFHAEMHNLISHASGWKASRSRMKATGYLFYQVITTPELFQFAEDIYSFVLQTDDAYYVSPLKHVLLVIFDLLKSRSVDINVHHFEVPKMRDRMDQLYARMYAEAPGTKSHEQLKDLYLAICSHFVHRPLMNVALTQVQHQRMIDFIAVHGLIQDCKTFIGVLERRNHLCFPHPAIIRMMIRIFEHEKEERRLLRSALPKQLDHKF